MVQVEQRLDVQHRFGQARTDDRQLYMTLSQLLAKLCSNKSSGQSHQLKENNSIIHPGEYLYLSTQVFEEEEEEEEDSNDTEEIKHSVPIPWCPTPCQQLIEHGIIPTHIPLAGKLMLHSCNLWLGRSKAGSSSGLHHDFRSESVV